MKSLRDNFPSTFIAFLPGVVSKSLHHIPPISLEGMLLQSPGSHNEISAFGLIPHSREGLPPESAEGAGNKKFDGITGLTG